MFGLVHPPQVVKDLDLNLQHSSHKMHIHRQESKLLESQAVWPYRKDSVRNQAQRLRTISHILCPVLEFLEIFTIGITNDKNPHSTTQAAEISEVPVGMILRSTTEYPSDLSQIAKYPLPPHEQPNN
jgi:hypothetical protein